jgi:hypothetical protein
MIGSTSIVCISNPRCGLGLRFNYGITRFVAPRGSTYVGVGHAATKAAPGDHLDGDINFAGEQLGRSPRRNPPDIQYPQGWFKPAVEANPDDRSL